MWLTVATNHIKILWYGVTPALTFWLLAIAQASQKLARNSVTNIEKVQKLVLLHALIGFVLISLLTFANWKGMHDSIVMSSFSVDPEAHSRHWGQAMINELGWLYSAGVVLCGAGVRAGHRTQLRVTLASWLLFLASSVFMFHDVVVWNTILLRSVWLVGLTCLVLIGSWHSETTERQHFTDELDLKDRLVYVEAAEKEKERRVKAESRADAERNLMAFLCHEIRNPFNGITGSLEQISLRVHESELDIKEWCFAALASSKYLIDILDNVMDQSKLEQGKLMLEQKEIDFGSLCHSCVNMLRHTKQPAVELSVSVPPGLTIMGDHMRWRQVLVNLLSNALKFTVFGGVTLSVVRRDSTTLFVAVSDTGPGISPELAPRLFEKYAQGASSHKGSGLGLSIAQLIVKLHGATIKVGVGDVTHCTPIKTTNR